ncbi:unnamed protein product [Blepharisma stoltei]|uniref:Uncharacterized protein n=1 Tax=Blepharisma stoltei TaxID=1481888 RepID=A0AAU9JEY1_9CILI|nr:unnamed protein product [Blepharisma stoltei]
MKEDIILASQAVICQIPSVNDFLQAFSLKLRAQIKESAYQKTKPQLLECEYFFGSEQKYEYSFSIAKDIPYQLNIYEYLCFLSDTLKFTIETWILAAAYLEKVLLKIPLLCSNWRKLVTYSIFNSQKISERNELCTTEFADIIPNIEVVDFILMGFEYQRLIEYNYEVYKEELIEITESTLGYFPSDSYWNWEIDEESLEKVAKNSKEIPQEGQNEVNIYTSETIYCINTV